MAFDSRIHAAYLEEGPEASELSEAELRELDHAEPSPVMLFFQRLGRRIMFLVKLTVFLGLVGAYPVSIFLSHRIDDSDIVFANGQNWAYAADGVAITRQLKANPALAGIPVIMITGHSERNILQASLAAGAVDFLVKPFERERMHAKLAKFLHGRGRG